MAVGNYILACLAFALSFCGCGAVIWLSQRYKIGCDDTAGVQRLHCVPVARIGGLPMGLAFGFVLLISCVLEPSLRRNGLFLLVVLLPTFVAGVTEDFTQHVGVRLRLLVTMLSAALGALLLGAVLSRVSIPGVDQVLSRFEVAALALTLIAGAGIPHAINIVDGCNGLSSSAGLAAFVGLGALAFILGDSFVAKVALFAACATFGFVLWNFPRGKIFLGDGGAYSMGVLIAELSILLIVRHPQVSAWFALLLVIHPVWEVLYSCGRRSHEGLRCMFQPDRGHLHQLVYSRVFLHFLNANDPYQQAWASALTAVTFTAWHVALLILALLFWDNSIVLVLCVLGFIVVYGVSYRVLNSIPARSWQPHEV